MNIILLKNSKDTIFKKDDIRAKHIKKILKLKEGENFKAGIINKELGICTINSIEDGTYNCTYKKTKTPESLLPITLLCGMVRPITAKRILKDATTIGISKIIFTTTDKGEKSYQKSKLWTSEEIEKHILEGASQSGNPLLPKIEICHSLKNSLEKIACETQISKICLDNTLKSPHLKSLKLTSPITIAIGSERGWSSRELTILQENNFQIANIGNRILRTETAIPITTGIVLSKI